MPATDRTQKLGDVLSTMTWPRRQLSTDSLRAIEQARANRALQERVERSNIPRRHLARIDDPALNAHAGWKKNLAIVRAKLGRGVVVALLGKRGTGKTQAAAMLIVEAVRRSEVAKYVSALTFYIELRGSYKTGATEKESEILRRYTLPSLLVIDEMHERGDSPWVERMLTHLIDARYNSQRDTILIANQSVHDFALSVGSSIVDRSREGGGVLVYDWESFRGRDV